MTVHTDLDLARNAFGLLDGDVRARIAAYLERPTTDRWGDIHGLLLCRWPLLTVWHAVRVIDPTFPTNVHLTDNGQPIWPRIPDAETVRQAIRYATH